VARLELYLHPLPRRGVRGIAEPSPGGWFGLPEHPPLSSGPTVGFGRDGGGDGGALTIVVLVLLAVLWVVVLAPSLLRERARRRSTGSVIKFRRQLRVIQRAAPHAIPPANRRVPPATFPLSESASWLVSQAADEGVVLPLVQAAELGKGRRRPMGEPPHARERCPVSVPGQAWYQAGRTGWTPARQLGTATRPVTQRRRKVAMGMVLSAMATFLFGFVPHLQPLWWVSLISLVGLGAYLFTLARIRSLTLDRRLKLAYLPEHLPKQTAGRRPPVSNPEGLLRQSATS
jgi:hypothetical protein